MLNNNNTFLTTGKGVYQNPKFIIYNEKVFSFVKTRSVPVVFQIPFLL